MISQTASVRTPVRRGNASGGLSRSGCARRSGDVRSRGRGRQREPRVQMFPLNSRRLTAGIIARIAAALGTLLADSRQMVEGKLAEDREPKNVQVDIVSADWNSWNSRLVRWT